MYITTTTTNNNHKFVIKGIHLGPVHWIVPGQVLAGKPPPGAGNQLQTSQNK